MTSVRILPIAAPGFRNSLPLIRHLLAEVRTGPTRPSRTRTDSRA